MTDVTLLQAAGLHCSAVLTTWGVVQACSVVDLFCTWLLTGRVLSTSSSHPCAVHTTNLAVLLLLRLQVWAEVYVGGSATGRWLHIDGFMGCYDQPSVVEAAVVRRQPLSYVVACHEGAPKDVTRR